MPNLMWLFVLPFISAITVFFFPTSLGKIKRFAILLSLLPLAMLIYGNVDWIGANVQYAWLPALSINFHLTVDALSLLFLFLTTIVVAISILSVKCDQQTHPHLFYALVFLLEGLLFGFFTVRDLVVFTIFWEGMLLPLYFIINLWGGPQRQMAALKFLIYMITGSVFMVVAVLALYFASGSTDDGLRTFNIDALTKVGESAPYAFWLCGIFLLAFSVKTPLFPFHAWLPDAYYQASTPGTILLSGILSKAGIYGILRIVISFFPDQMKEWNPWLLSLAVIGVFYGALSAWMQTDYKRLIAYSSFSHVNFILVGLFVWNQTAHTGAILQAFNHGITITALFLVAGWLENRLHTTSIALVSGLDKYMPHLCWLTLFFVLSNVALPGMNNFVGELLILFGLFSQNPWLATILGITVILSVVYMLRWMQKMYFGPPSPYQSSWNDIHTKELLVATPLVALILWIGIYPSPVLKQIQSSSDKPVVAKLEWSQ